MKKHADEQVQCSLQKRRTFLRENSENGDLARLQQSEQGWVRVEFNGAEERGMALI